MPPAVAVPEVPKPKLPPKCAGALSLGGEPKEAPAVSAPKVALNPVVAGAEASNAPPVF